MRNRLRGSPVVQVGWMILRTVLVLASLQHSPAVATDWPQWRGPDRNNSWNEPGIPETFPAHGLEIRWRVPAGFGFSSPVVAQGRVYLSDLQLDRSRSEERVLCFDEVTGRSLWVHHYPVHPPEWAFTPGQETGPNATPICDSGRVYSIGWHGDLVCLDALTGAVVWKKDLAGEFPDGELRTTSSPLIDRDLLILVIGGKPDACVIALEKNSGREIWRALGDGAGYSSPMIITAGRARQLIVWTPEAVTSLNPTNGTTYWRQPMVFPNDLVVSSPVATGDRLLTGGVVWQLRVDLPGASLLWPEEPKPTRRVLSVTSTALLHDDYLYSARLNGELVCLESATGRQLWATNTLTDLKPGASLHLTETADSVVIFTDRGELIRAKLSAAGYRELSRSPLIPPLTPFAGRNVAWAPPAYANGHVLARNSRELLSASLRE